MNRPTASIGPGLSRCPRAGTTSDCRSVAGRAGSAAMGIPVRTALALLLLSSVAVAQGDVPQAEPAPEPSLVRRYAVGPRLIIAPGVFIPSSGSAGFSLGVVGGYGFDLGPVIPTPGVIAPGNGRGDWNVYTGLAGLRVTLPVGNFGPFVEGGIGYGHVGGPLGYSAGGLALRAGAGFIIFFSQSFALG